MRLSVYVSEAVKVNQLSDIVATAEKENPSHQITGVLSYNQGYYLQIVEGHTGEVKAFDKIIRKDSRHKNIRKILNFETRKRCFSDWSINLAPLLKRNESFLTIVDRLNGRVDSMTFEKRRLFSIFHPLAESNSQKNKLDPLAYSIDEWPDFAALDATSSLMSLCGSLMQKPTCFRTIVSQNAHESEEALRTMLRQLNEAGYLQVAQMSNLTQAVTKNDKKNSQRNGFLNSIEKFGKSSIKRNLFQKVIA